MTPRDIKVAAGVVLTAVVICAQARAADMGTGGTARGDERRCDVPIERTGSEIQDSVMAGLTVYSLTIEPASLRGLPTWRRWTSLTAETDIGTISVPPSSAAWTSSNPSVATVDGNGVVTAQAPGSALIMASYGGAEDTVDFTVTAPVREPEVEALDSYLTTLPGCYLHEMPVAIIRYLPTKDGVNIDSSVCGWSATITQLKTRDLPPIHVPAAVRVDRVSPCRAGGAEPWRSAA